MKPLIFPSLFVLVLLPAVFPQAQESGGLVPVVTGSVTFADAGIVHITINLNGGNGMADYKPTALVVHGGESRTAPTAETPPSADSLLQSKAISAYGETLSATDDYLAGGDPYWVFVEVDLVDNNGKAYVQYFWDTFSDTTPGSIPGKYDKLGHSSSILPMTATAGPAVYLEVQPVNVSGTDVTLDLRLHASMLQGSIAGNPHVYAGQSASLPSGIPSSGGLATLQLLRADKGFRGTAAGTAATNSGAYWTLVSVPIIDRSTGTVWYWLDFLHSDSQEWSKWNRTRMRPTGIRLP